MELTATPSTERLFAHDDEHLRQSALANLIPLIAALAWIALLDAMRSRQHSPWALVTLGALTIGCAMAALRRRRRPRLARYYLIAALVIAYWSLVLTYPAHPVRALGLLVVTLAAGMLSQKTNLAIAGVLCLGLAAIEWLAPATRLGWRQIAWYEALLLGAVALTWIARNHLYTALAWSSESTSRSLELAEALRDRQLQLNRTLRAMEEATYRVERMNNELVLAQREAQRGRIAKSRFAATVSHEIRGPLNLILGFARLLALSPERYGAELTYDYYTDVDVVYRNAQHLSQLVDDVLDLSRAEVAHLPLIKQQIDLAQDVVAETLGNVRPLAESKGLALIEESQPGLPPLMADPVRLRQALLNLVLNAIRLTERGSVRVSTRAQERDLIVAVSDTGPGIPPERLDRLFQEFSQLHAERERSEGGTGLGLSITKHLVEAHGGRISVESQIGVGTTLVVALPMGAEAQGRAGLETPREIERRRAEHDTCLVLHSDPSVVNLLARHIGGYDLVGLAEASHLAETVEYLHPRALIVDSVDLPRARELLAQQPFDVPLLSCALPRHNRAEGMEGVLGYLTKPLDAVALNALIGFLADRPAPSVLIVDDEPDAARLMETVLEALHLNAKVRKAFHGRQALDLMAQALPDLVLIDWFMPELNGGETLARMRQNERLRHVPAIIVSGRDWLEEGATLGSPLAVERRQPIEVAAGARCLGAMLDQLTPDYIGQGR